MGLTSVKHKITCPKVLSSTKNHFVTNVSHFNIRFKESGEEKIYVVKLIKPN